MVEPCLVLHMISWFVLVFVPHEIKCTKMGDGGERVKYCGHTCEPEIVRCNPMMVNLTQVQTRCCQFNTGADQRFSVYHSCKPEIVSLAQLQTIDVHLNTGANRKLLVYCWHLCIDLCSEVMDQLKENLPSLDKIVAEIEELAHSGGKYQEAPHVIEVTLPMVCRSEFRGVVCLGWCASMCMVPDLLISV